MLQRWIYEGELEDPYNEFFVACDASVQEEELWLRKYSMRNDMLPSFISKALAQKVGMLILAIRGCVLCCAITLYSLSL